jgi:8-oxo-dGTP diphosphatase
VTPRGYGPRAAFCPRCAAPLGGPPPTTCAACAYQLFVNPRPTGGVILVRDRAFLALRRARGPERGRWALPGGFCDAAETPAEAAVREAYEEVGAIVTLGHLVGMYLGAYAFQDEVLPVLDCFFLARQTGGELALKPDEASEMHWFALDEPPRMAFPSMDRGISDARQLFAR